MSTLNIRDVPDALLKQVRIRVAEGQAESSRAFIIQAIEEKLSIKETAEPVRKGVDQATGEKPDGADRGVPSAHLGGNGPNAGQGRGSRGAGGGPPESAPFNSTVSTQGRYGARKKVYRKRSVETQDENRGL